MCVLHTETASDVFVLVISIVCFTGLLFDELICIAGMCLYLRDSDNK